jgi:integrase
MNARVYKLDLAEVIQGGFQFSNDLPISSESFFGSDNWNFADDKKIRLNSVIAAKLTIPWATYSTYDPDIDTGDHRSAFLPPQIIYELKVFAFFYLKLPSVFSTRGPQSIKPQTVVTTIRVLVRLFSDIYQSHLLRGISLTAQSSHIRSLSNISLNDLRCALKRSDRADGRELKKGLRLLATPVLREYFSEGPLAWNDHDVISLEFRFNSKRQDYIRAMPNELFRFLSNSACADILGFIHLLGLKPYDNALATKSSQIISFEGNGRAMFEDYVVIRDKDRKAQARSGIKSHYTQSERKAFTSIYGISVKEFFAYLYRVQRAAYTVIGLYTGARYSDMTSFKTGCIENRQGCYVLIGTHTKHEDLTAEEDVDIWPAIPIMRDALQCLEEISRITFNPYLISGCETVAVGKTPQPLSLNGFASAINTYLAEIDESKRWVHWHINPHQLRHTLAYQLARADVGLIFIAHQMKHLYTALNALPPNTTLMYGNIGELKQQRAMQMEPAYIEAAKELYSPQQPVAGGGAEEFKQRRKMYFEGMAASGWTEDELIEHLARQGLPFASVGIGYCGGKRERLLKDGTKEVPPCLGSLQCNPATCAQAVITRTHLPQWQKILEQNDALACDKRMAHAENVFRAAAETARDIIDELSKSPAETNS